MAQWRLFLVVGALAAAVQLALPDGIPRVALYTAVSIVGVAAVVVGVRRRRPARWAGWYLLAGGFGLWALGDIIWTWYEYGAHTDPFPSVADLFYLLGYPVLAAGVYQLASGRNRRPGDHTGLIDVLIVTLVAGLLLWVAFIDPAWHVPEGALVDRLVAVAYPVGDFIILTQLVHLGAASRARSGAVRLLGASVILVMVADVLYQALAYLPGLDEHWLDPLWLGGYLLAGAAALHPSMGSTGEGRPPADRAFDLGRLLFLAAAVAVLPLISLTESLAGLHGHVAEVAGVGLVLIVLVISRMIGLVLQMREQAAKLAHHADVDFLTGLDSRRRFSERVEDAAACPEGRQRMPGAVMFVALERFTEINDTLGHRTGDELLREVADRLRSRLDTDTHVARMGGDVFAVLMPAADSADGLLPQARSLRALLVEPLVLSDLSVAVDGAVGVVQLPRDGTDVQELLHRADVALAAARETGSRVALWTPEMERGGTLAPALMAELRSALTSGEVVVHFQPQIEVHTGRVFGAEALVRWQHPEHGLLAPMTFVPAAERTGLIRLLTLYVLDRALAQCAAWQAQGRDLSVAVNLSVRNLLDPGLVGDVRAALIRHDVDASRLELEITETMAMVDPTRSVEILGALDSLGVTLSVDDYGTGYGSLAYLQRLPVRRLKIDRSFVAGVLDDPASAAIVRSTIDLAHQLGLSVIAEGVEDDETLLVLRDMHCYGAQGFGLGRPVAGDAVLALIDASDVRLPALVGPGTFALESQGF
ncbi:MAG TPA: bifunctional diguanylate cyclase/phosphodiesterase [Actinotalea sp.]